MVGLNGSGKTTSSAKLARFLQTQGHRPALVPCDLQRPAAIEQLVTLGKQIDVPVYAPDLNEKNVQRAVAATLANTRTEPALSGVGRGGPNVYIFDTAGRQEINESLIQERRELKQFLTPKETLLVVDPATCRQGDSVASHFDH